MQSQRTHADGSICPEGTSLVPPDFSPCCEDFSEHTLSCYYDIRYEWDEADSEWVIVIPNSAGGGGILISYCPHCGASLSATSASDSSLK